MHRSGSGLAVIESLPKGEVPFTPRTTMSSRSNSSTLVWSGRPRHELLLMLVAMLLWSTTVLFLTGRNNCSEPALLHTQVSHGFSSPFISGALYRPQIRAFIGVQTGFTELWRINNGQYEYERRRRLLRKYWFPANRTEMDRMLQQYGFVFRFVIGRTENQTAEDELQREIMEYGPMLRLSLMEGYGQLSFKSHAYFTAVMKQFNPQFVVKMDDDVYFRPDRLFHSLSGYSNRGFGYIGCMAKGNVIVNNTLRWFEPRHMLLGSSYNAHAWGPAYILSREAAQTISLHEPDALRHLINEDVTIGLWMLTFNIKFFDDRRLCMRPCTGQTIVGYSNPDCAGICNPVADMKRWHHRCGPQRSPALPKGKKSLPMMMPVFRFNNEMFRETEQNETTQAPVEQDSEGSGHSAEEGS